MKKILAAFLLISASAFAQSAGVGSIWTAPTATLQSAATANGNGTPFAVQGLAAVALTVNCSVACSGGTTITFQVSQDGTNYSAANGLQTGTTTVSSTVVNQGTTPTIWFVNVAGMADVRAVISSYSAGTITVTGTAVGSGLSHLTTVISGTLSSNTAQVNGVTTSTGAGAVGTGAQRIAVGQDTTTIAGSAPGTAGTPSAQVVSIQGVGSGTAVPISGSLNPNQSVNVAQIAGSTTSTAATGVQKVGVVGNAGAAVDQAPGSAAPANAIQIGVTDGTNTRVPLGDPCGYSAWTYYPINVSANTQVVAGSASKNVYVCEAFLAPVAAAANVNIVESATSGNACATSPTGMMGGNTAALGAQLAVNGGFVLPATPYHAWMKTATSGDAMCIFASAQVTGVLAYVQF